MYRFDGKQDKPLALACTLGWHNCKGSGVFITSKCAGYDTINWARRNSNLIGVGE